MLKWLKYFKREQRTPKWFSPTPKWEPFWLIKGMKHGMDGEIGINTTIENPIPWFRINVVLVEFHDK